MPVAMQSTAGDAGRKRDTQIAAHPVEGERAPARLRDLDQHRHADRVIDRREHAEPEQRRRQDRQIGREGGSAKRDAAADEEGHHHVAPAPAIGQPSGG
jgi:hypothetical protein